MVFDSALVREATGLQSRSPTRIHAWQERHGVRRRSSRRRNSRSRRLTSRSLGNIVVRRCPAAAPIEARRQADDLRSRPYGRVDGYKESRQGRDQRRTPAWTAAVCHQLLGSSVIAFLDLMLKSDTERRSRHLRGTLAQPFWARSGPTRRHSRRFPSRAGGKPPHQHELIEHDPRR